MAAHKPKSSAPKHQSKPMTLPSKAESKTSRPAKGRDIATPAVAFAPKSPFRKGKNA